MYKDVSEASQAKRDCVNSESDIWLYAKNHYIKRDDMWKDLKWLVGIYCLIDPEHISKWDVLNMLMRIAIPLIKDNEMRLRELLSDLSPNSIYNSCDKNRDTKTYEDYLLENLLRILQRQAVYKIDENGNKTAIVLLDPPDPNVLPLKNPTKWIVDRRITNDTCR